MIRTLAKFTVRWQGQALLTCHRLHMIFMTQCVWNCYQFTAGAAHKTHISCWFNLTDIDTDTDDLSLLCCYFISPGVSVYHHSPPLTRSVWEPSLLQIAGWALAGRCRYHSTDTAYTTQSNIRHREREEVVRTPEYHHNIIIKHHPY